MATSKLHSIKRAFFGDHSFSLRDVPGRSALLLPIRLTVAYLVFTVLLYAFGPYEWVTYKPVLLYGLLITYIVCLWFGYRVGLICEFRHEYEWTDKNILKLISIISPLIVVNFVFYSFDIFRSYALTSFDIVELAQQMWAGILNPGQGYLNNYERSLVSNSNNLLGGYFLTLVLYIWDFVELPIAISSMIFFKKLKPYAKLFAIAYLIQVSIFYLSIGTNIQIFYVFLLAEIPVLLGLFTSYYRNSLTKRQVIKSIVCIVIGIALVGVYFTWMMISRTGIDDYKESTYSIGGITVDIGESPDAEVPTDEHDSDTTNNSSEVPPEDNSQAAEDNSSSTVTFPVLTKFWVYFCNYITQGYYGMSLALTEPWIPMYGSGNSMFVVDFVSAHFSDIDQYTYQKRIEHYDWGSDRCWHSIYTWLANDVSFYGVPFVMILLGLLFAAMFRDAVSTKNPFAKVSIFYFVIIMIFIPCNNQVAQTPQTLFSFIFVVICWLISKLFLSKLKTKQEHEHL